MYEKKKVTIILVVVLVLAVALFIFLLKPIIHSPFGAVTINYISNDGERILSVQLTGKEARIVRRILNGKIFDIDLHTTGAGCGFGPNRAIEIGNTVYYVSYDSCGVVQTKDTKFFYHLTSKEWENLWAIFEAHGADLNNRYQYTEVTGDSQ